jgi:phosphatidylserine/phosphatidylglycerophosphate/cardiolipin synthase-like enzyme
VVRWLTGQIAQEVSPSTTLCDRVRLVQDEHTVMEVLLGVDQRSLALVRVKQASCVKQESLDVLVALGFPREVFRFQPACHNKTIIVDRKAVMFGSHNWSNEGVKANRDASLIFDDKEIANYLADVYDYDWNRLATAHRRKSDRALQAAESKRHTASSACPFRHPRSHLQFRRRSRVAMI